MNRPPHRGRRLSALANATGQKLRYPHRLIELETRAHRGNLNLLRRTPNMEEGLAFIGPGSEPAP